MEPADLRAVVVGLRVFLAAASPATLLQVIVEAGAATIIQLAQNPTKLQVFAHEVQPAFCPAQGRELAHHIFLLTHLRRVLHNVKATVPLVVDLGNDRVSKLSAPARPIDGWLQALDLFAFVE